MYSQYHNQIQKWHPQSTKFERNICQTVAEEAIREAEELRQKIKGRRILEAVN